MVKSVNIDRDTSLSLLPDLRDWVAKDYLVHFVIDAMDAVDTSVAVRLLCADTHPDHDTLCGFRRKNAARLSRAFAQVLELAANCGVFKVGAVTVAEPVGYVEKLARPSRPVRARRKGSGQLHRRGKPHGMGFGLPGLQREATAPPRSRPRPRKTSCSEDQRAACRPQTVANRLWRRCGRVQSATGHALQSKRLMRRSWLRL